jgi:hypothetical protein
VQNDILRCNASWELAVNLDLHVLTAAGDEGLSSEDVLDFTGTDTEGKGAEGTVCGSVAVTADDSCAGESETLLGTNNVHDTLALVTHSKVCKTKVLDVLLEGRALQAGVVLFNEFFDVLEVFSRCGGDVLARRLSVFVHQDMASHRKAYMVDSDKGAVRPADFAACVLEAFKGLLFNLLAAKQNYLTRGESLRRTGEVTSWTRCLSSKS